MSPNLFKKRKILRVKTVFLIFPALNQIFPRSSIMKVRLIKNAIQGTSTSNSFNRRLISLTPLFCKHMKYIICTSSISNLNKRNLCEASQRGLRRNPSYVTFPVKLPHNMHVNIHSRDKTCILFIHFAEVHDTTPHLSLPFQISISDLDPSVLQGISSYLT